MSPFYVRSFPVISFLLLACLPAAGQVQSGEKGQAPANVANPEDPLPRGALARLGTLRWRHTQPISFLAILPDGSTVLTVCQDQTVHLWDSKTGQQVRQFGPPRKSENLLDSPMGNLKWAGRSGPGAAPPLASLRGTLGRWKAVGFLQRGWTYSPLGRGSRTGRAHDSHVVPGPTRRPYRNPRKESIGGTGSRRERSNPGCRRERWRD